MKRPTMTVLQGSGILQDIRLVPISGSPVLLPPALMVWTKEDSKVTLDFKLPLPIMTSLTYHIELPKILALHHSRGLSLHATGIVNLLTPGPTIQSVRVKVYSTKKSFLVIQLTLGPSTFPSSLIGLSIRYDLKSISLRSTIFQSYYQITSASNDKLIIGVTNPGVYAYILANIPPGAPNETFPYRLQLAPGIGPFTVYIPTAQERQGDFSDLPKGLVLYDPNTGAPFPGNVIPPNLLPPNTPEGSGLYAIRFTT